MRIPLGVSRDFPSATREALKPSVPVTAVGPRPASVPGRPVSPDPVVLRLESR